MAVTGHFDGIVKGHRRCHYRRCLSPVAPLPARFDSSMGPLRLIMISNALRDIRSALAVRSTRATAAYITRLTATATFAYVLATLIPGTTDRPVLAPLTALLVLQASLYQTIRSGLKKVLSVAAGVVLAVGLAELIGFSWWQLMLVIAA